MRSHWTQRIWIGATLAWLALVVAGVTILTRHSLTPGLQGEPPDHWPSVTVVERSATTHTLVLVAHPRCPCTQATFDELEAILTRCQGSLAVRVLFYQPEGSADSWGDSRLWRRAHVIPGVVAFLDQRGALARRFGALTSGQTALYDAGGQLVYRGGITGARGHAGPNAGRDAIITMIEQRRSAPSRQPVFGCPLDRPDTAERKERPSCVPS